MTSHALDLHSAVCGGSGGIEQVEESRTRLLVVEQARSGRCCISGEAVRCQKAYDARVRAVQQDRLPGRTAASQHRLGAQGAGCTEPRDYAVLGAEFLRIPKVRNSEVCAVLGACDENAESGRAVAMRRLSKLVLWM